MSEERKPVAAADETPALNSKRGFGPAGAALVSAVIAFILIFAVFAVFGYAPFGNRILLYSDGDYQYFDLILYYKRVFAGEASFFYTLGKSLGGNGYAVFAYYLASPVMLLSLLFKAEDTALCMNIISAMKIALASGTAAYALTGRFPDRKSGRAVYAVLIAVSYGMSQFMLSQTCNMMWLDGAVMLPLVILGTYRLVKGKSGLLICLSIALSLLFNWYTGILNCMFSACWLLFEMFVCRARLIKSILRYAAYMMAGILTSGIILLPVLLIQADRTHGSGGLKELLMPGIVGNPASLISDYSPGMVCIKGYCSLFAGSLVLIGVLLFFLCGSFDRRTKAAVLVMMVFTAMTYFFRPLVTVFSIFRNVESYWYRYSYMGIFLLCLAAAAFFLKGDGVRPGPAILSAAVFSLLSVLFNLLFKEKTLQYIFKANVKYVTGMTLSSDMQYALSKIVLPVIFTLILLPALAGKKGLGSAPASALVALFTAAELVLAGGMLLAFYSSDRAEETALYVRQEKELVEKVKAGDRDGFYRILQTSERSKASTGNTANYNEGLGYGFNSVSSFVSDPEESQGEFLARLGFPFHSETITVTSSPILPAESLIGVRYVLSEFDCPGMEKMTSDSDFKNVYKNPYCLPAAFTTASEPGGDAAENPFEYQNEVYSAITGEKTRLFSPAAYSAIRADKKTEFQIAVPEGRYILYGRLLPDEGVSGDTDINGVYGLTTGKFLSPDVFVIPLSPDSHYASVTIGTTGNIRPEFYILDMDRFEDCIAAVRKKGALKTDIRAGHAEITADASSEGEKLYVSVPYDASWKVTVNGKNVTPETFGGCMMLIPLEKGENAIVMNYRPPYMTAGLISSAAGLLMCVCLAVIHQKKTRTEKQK